MDQETNDLIKNEIENNEVCLFMKGTPDAPQCGFSMATSNILKVLEVNFKGINVLADQKLREGIKVYSDITVCNKPDINVRTLNLKLEHCTLGLQ